MDDVLLDTHVLSELVKPKPDARVMRFFLSTNELWLSSMTLHELAYGADRALDPRRREKLVAWISRIRADYADRTIAVNDTLAEASGRLRALAARRGRPVSVIDAIIASTAQAHGLRLATRNTRDFELFAVDVFDPWEGAE